jgi:hypothetical protein
MKRSEEADKITNCDVAHSDAAADGTVNDDPTTTTTSTIDRRRFLALSGAFVVLCAVGWCALPKPDASSPAATASPTSTPATPTPPGATPTAAPATAAADAVGPLLQDGLVIASTASGAEVLHDGEVMFTVNESGRTLLHLANGTKTLNAIIETAGLQDSAVDVGMFFVGLGEAGYLKNRVEIELFENEVPREASRRDDA